MSQTTLTAATVAPAPEAMTHLRHMVARNAGQLRGIVVLEATALAVSVPLAYLWLVLFLDTRVHLSLAGRVLACLGLIAGIAFVARHVVQRWRSLRITEDEVALAIERRTPGGVQNRLINAVQLARGGSSDMSDAVVAENCAVLHRVHLEQAAQLRPALLRVGGAALLVALGAGFWLWQPEHFTNAVARIFLPLADIDPLYRTTLVVEPGDVEARGDVTIHITIRGERPATLTLIKQAQGKRTTETIPVEPGDGPLAYTFRDVAESLKYAVRGGDYMTAYYQITVPRTTSFRRLRVSYRYPEYTGLAEKTVEAATGELEALAGTRARLHFTLDHPAEAATLELAGRTPSRLALQRVAEQEFAGEIVLDDLTAYRVEIDGHKHGPYAVRVLEDQAPKLELSGLERRSEVQVDGVLTLEAGATDDYGLDKVALCQRRSGAKEWTEIVEWPTGRKTTFRQQHELAVASLQAAEGDRIELTLRARDTAPARQGTWTMGPVHELVVGGEGVALQVQYEQLLRSEDELKALQRSQQELLATAALWLRKLDGDGGLRWDDAKNIDALHAAVRELNQAQEKLRQTTGQTARNMLNQAGNLRISVSLLADTEMVRTQRILEAVASREAIQAKRAALADARLTQERIGRSLQDLLEQYALFRSDWELGHMIPFTKMLAERQARLRDASQAPTQKAGPAEVSSRGSMSRRQAKVADLCVLIRPALAGLAERLKEQEPDVARAFESGATVLGSAELLAPLRQAVESAQAGRWPDTVVLQTKAAEVLAGVHARLKDAQAEATRKALAALKEKAKSDLEAQKELDKLAAGTDDAFVKDFTGKIKLEDTIRMREVAGGKSKSGDPNGERAEGEDPLLGIFDKAKLELKEDSGVRQDTSVLSLAKEPGSGSMPKLSKERGSNKVKPFLQEEYDDLVGKLLDETEELTKDYQTLTLSTNQNNNDAGDVGKIGGTLNSTGAVASTGNQKPPSLESGGVARTGRQGARAYGMVAGEEGVNRRGRDKAQEGREQVADQAGVMKMQGSEDPQKDLSTGVGGKRVASDDNHFSLHDAGRWKDEMAKRMEKPQAKNYIVERQGEKLDPRVAAQLRDLTSKQEQIIERIKAIKKELRNLYLPTEHLDELAAALEANLEALKDKPDAELFRLQMQTLDRLRGAARVFAAAGAALEPSLPRERRLRGRVLDEPTPPALPGYEDAVKSYYLKLANQ
jgi:hypothetical protein